MEFGRAISTNVKLKGKDEDNDKGKDKDCMSETTRAYRVGLR